MDIKTLLRRVRKFVSDNYPRAVALALILSILAVIFLGVIIRSRDLSPDEAAAVVGRLILGVIALVIVAFPLVGVTYLIVNRIKNRKSPTKGGRVSTVIWALLTIYGTLFLIVVINDTAPEYLAPSLVALLF